MFTVFFYITYKIKNVQTNKVSYYDEYLIMIDLQ